MGKKQMKQKIEAKRKRTEFLKVVFILVSVSMYSIDVSPYLNMKLYQRVNVLLYRLFI